MKSSPLLTILSILILSFSGCQKVKQITDAITGPTVGEYSETNDFFSEGATQKLKGKTAIIVTGETEQETSVEVNKLYLRTVTCKEVVMHGEDTTFIGAYRYDGYSLCDIISKVKHNKTSKEDFYPTVDMYIEVYNEAGDMARFSWGEIFYSANPHAIIIASQVTPVIPGKTKEEWPIPTLRKIVASNDMFNDRFIENPTRIVVKSLPLKYEVNREIKSYEGTFSLLISDSLIKTFDSLPSNLHHIEIPLTQYGHGMGYKGNKMVHGENLAELLGQEIKNTHDLRQKGYFSIAAKDGYRTVFSFSEIMNRNDGRQTMIELKPKKGYTISNSYDFFVDRAVKMVQSIELFK